MTLKTENPGEKNLKYKDFFKNSYKYIGRKKSTTRKQELHGSTRGY